MKLTLLKCALIIYMSSLLVFVVYFPEHSLTGNELDHICEKRISDIKRHLEGLVNKTTDDGYNQSTKEHQTKVYIVNKHKEYGPGAYGEDTVLNPESLNPDEREERRVLYNKHDYDAFISDMVSIYRVLPDTRPDVCRNMKYGDLPEVSIIVPFRDERLSVLLRTVYSILQNTPHELLAEILLIDDGSKTAELNAKLDLHVEALNMVDVIRMNESVGLMTARQTGIDRSKADYFITMDCHIEVVKGWLEPLLHRLLQNPKACLSPNVGLLKRDDFGVDMRDRWTFNKFPMFAFNLDEAHSFYKNKYLQEKNRSEPFPTGMNQGMVIAMKKSWFYQLGGFDTGMKVWGSEQIELSVKVWTCGGKVEIIPCSYIAHLFKKRLVWNMGNSRIRNVLRFAEVWMDDYKHIIYDYWPTVKQQIDPGPGLIERRIIRRQNRCKPFQYFIDKVKEFGVIHFPENLKNKGWISSHHNDKCISITPDSVALEQCNMNRGENQFYEHTEEYHIRHIQRCIYPAGMKNADIKGLTMDECETLAPEKIQWIYTQNSELRHIRQNLCLTISKADMSLIFEKCTGKVNQRWRWSLWKT